MNKNSNIDRIVNLQGFSIHKILKDYKKMNNFKLALMFLF